MAGPLPQCLTAGHSRPLMISCRSTNGCAIGTQLGAWQSLMRPAHTTSQSLVGWLTPSCGCNNVIHSPGQWHLCAPDVHVGKDLAVWRDNKGTWHAFEDACPHRLVEGDSLAVRLHCAVPQTPGLLCPTMRRLAPLSEGRVEKDGTLLCGKAKA
jgi:nitrite reductase/ring-hydroxylating ferredoxin subunit